MLEGKDADFEKPVLIPDRGKFAAQLGYRTIEPLSLDA